MPSRETYLIRNPQGHMSAMESTSTRRALADYLDSQKGAAAIARWEREHPGETCYVSVKVRGAGAWETFTVR